ncbi:MAG: hypothetical protein ACRDPK_19955 [Carbonactinosporaceae bacterium]
MVEIVCDRCGQRFDDHPHDFLVHACVAEGPPTRLKVLRADGGVEYHDPADPADAVVLGPHDRFQIEPKPEPPEEPEGGSSG